ncbi:DNA topoisomerase 1 [Clarias magur]|uniref:DNA topoisomerase 1 n=1 Tax=Clarias magur TaxID=1594786 RepID=A0A8J4TK37_CLAMG|nr:DNA topoisomerase 1 [Clarias magur]
MELRRTEERQRDADFAADPQNVFHVPEAGGKPRGGLISHRAPGSRSCRVKWGFMRRGTEHTLGEPHALAEKDDNDINENEWKLQK